MSQALLFWILMLLWLVLGVVWNRPSGPGPISHSLLLFILVGLLGWSAFGAPIR
jgi:hypothetical protein